MSAVSLSTRQARLLRLRAQRLAPRLAVGGTASAIAANMVYAVGGVQAQEAPAAALAICARSLGLGVADVERARVADRSVVRLWAMRNTLHLVAATDLGWLLSLLGPTFIAGSHRRYTQLGLDEANLASGVRAIRELLATHGPLTRSQLVERIASGYGLRLEGQMAPYLIARAALEGYICLGPDRGAKPTYVLLDDWLGAGWRRRTLPRDEATVELARRHLGAYAPATPEDFAAWSGLPMSEARTAWRRLGGELIEVEADGRPMWLLATQTDWLDDAPAGRMRPVRETPIVRLLPAYDTLLLGYRNRDLLLAPEYIKRVNAGGGIIHPTLLIDGRIVGTWKQMRRRNGVEIAVAPFETLGEEALAGLASEATAMGGYLGVKANWRVEPPAT